MLRTLARFAPLTPPLPRLLRWLSGARAARRQRTRLLDLDARMLRDIGVTETEARKEARRALWDVPDRWRR
jgi:uncharacterized protein YjiS (DUF1127 family)